MPERSHDTAEDGFHEIQLSGKQLVFLFMTATLVSVFIFLCGVRIGRGARDVRLGETVTTSAAATVPAATPPLADAGPQAAEPPAPAETGLTYHDELQGSGTPKQALKKPEPRTTPPPQVAPSPAARAAAPSDVPTSGRPGTHVIQVFVSRDRGAAAALVKKLGAGGYPAFLVLPESPSVPQMYKVQVGRYSEREAEQVARQLEKEGDFKPWVISSR